MKTNKIITSLVLFFPILLFGQKGFLKESIPFESKVLNETVKYSIYLPEDYEHSERSYPIFYLLHGYSDDETAWVQFGEANRISDELIASGEFPPCIIVMPDAKVTWYINSYDGKKQWADMFINEFIPYIEKTYRVREKKEFRAIGGLSMGGFGALTLAMQYTELFSNCIALSAGVFTDDEFSNMSDDLYKKRFANVLDTLRKGKERLEGHFRENNPMALVETVALDKLNSVRFYIDCGDDDYLSEGNTNLHIKMRRLGVKHEYRVRDGGHAWSYWRTGLPDAMRFMGASLRR